MYGDVDGSGSKSGSSLSKSHLLVVLIAAAIFFSVGAARAFRFSFDFVPVYTGARCLIHGCDPYQVPLLQQQFYHAGGRPEEQPLWEIDVPVYPPSTFLVLTPLSFFRYPAARLLWFLLNGSLLVTATALIVTLCPAPQRWLAAIVGSCILATSGILLVVGQPATLAISLVIIGSYLFLRQRALLPASALFMVSLAIKPQIGGFILLYFLTQRPYRRYAAVALGGALLILICAGGILWLNPGSAQWPATLHSNLASTLGPGGSADPRPANEESVGDVNLQTLTSIFFADAHRFNLTAYVIFLVLLAILGVRALRAAHGYETSTIVLAALATLTLTPVYHRFYDTRLLLLTLPGLMSIWQRRRLVAILMSVLTACAVVSVQYRVQMYLQQQAQWQNLLRHKLLFILLLRQQNLELLILFALYAFALVPIRLQSSETAQDARFSAVSLTL